MTKSGVRLEMAANLLVWGILNVPQGLIQF